jgi:hypothetical protein
MKNFWWPEMNDEIVKYIQSCPQFQKNIAARHKSYELLQLLQLAYMPWSSIAMDFITDLPRSDGCNQLWVIIDPFTKMGHFVLLKKHEKRAENLALVFPMRDMEIIWDTYQHSFGPGLVIYMEVLEGIPNGRWCETSDVDCVPSRDRWPN